MPDATYDPSTPVGLVRLLLSDVSAPFVFADADIAAFLSLEHDNPKRAAAQAIDTNATNEALASKVLTDSDGKSTNGASLADALRKHAAALRAQADRDDASADDESGGSFELASPWVGGCGPELVERLF